MDSYANERWNAKLAQSRTLRGKEYSANHSPASITEKILEINGCLIHDWISMFHSSWGRIKSSTPGLEAQQEKKRLSEIVELEKAKICLELEAFFKKTVSAEKVEELLLEAKKQFANSYAVLITKCHEEIENDCAIRKEELKKDSDARKEKRIDWLIQLLVGASIAILSAWVTNWFSRGDVDAIRNELIQLRTEYHQLVSWIVMSPSQIDSEIAYLKIYSKSQQDEVASKYVQKRKELAEKLASNGVLDSPVSKIPMEKLNKEEKSELESITRDVQRKIEVLVQKKAKRN